MVVNMARTPEQPTYEQSRDELAKVVSALESGGLSLEESLSLWEYGETLAKNCQTWLETARERVDPTATQD